MTDTAIYLRVITKQQDHRSQLADLNRFAESCHESVTWYRDKGSGSTMDRPEFNRMMEDVRVGKVSRVVVWRFDRLGRTAAGLTALFDELRDRKVILVSLRDGLDLGTHTGRLIAGIIASIAEYENEVRRERQRAGIEAARANNGGKCPWGGRPKGATTIDYRRAEQLRARSLRVSEVAQAIGCSRQSLYAHFRAVPGP